MPTTPPHQQEHTNYASGSPGQNTTSAVPPIPSTSSTLPPPGQPSTFNGQVFHHLPSNITALLAALPSIPAPRRHGRRPAAPIIAPTPVSFNYLFLFLFNLTYNS